MAEEKEEKHQLDDEVTHKEELHDDVVKAEAESDDDVKPANEESKDEEPKKEPETPKTDKKGFDLKSFLSTKKGKVVAGVVAAVVVLAVVFAIPMTRYGVLGLFIKKDVSLTLTDSSTKKPVTDATVELAGMTLKSDNDGKVKFKNVSVGPQNAKITKKYYKDSNVTVDVEIFSATSSDELSLEATGRQVPIKIINKFNGKAVEKAVVTAGDSTTITDDQGDAVLVVAAGQSAITANIKADGYNNLGVTIAVVEAFEPDNEFGVIPTGKLYFLSKRTGKINVMKSDLDGSAAEVVLAGTGKEEDTNTVLLASRDWKYLALLARREGTAPKVYLIDTVNKDKLTVIDEGNAAFSPLGWVDHDFAYKVTHEDTGVFKNGYQSIKSFNAETAKIATLDSTQYIKDAYGDLGQYYSSGPFLLANEIIYSKTWQSYVSYYGPTDDKRFGVYSVKANNTDKKTIVDYKGIWGYYSIQPYGPNEAYILPNSKLDQGYEYENGKLTQEKLTSDDVYNYQNTYLQSPSSNATFWSESRDGKTVLIVGDADGEKGEQVASVEGYKQYGWFSDDYLLLSKNDSELYIMGRATGSGLQPFKVTDYHKPAYNYSYYGGGYGGL